MTRAVAILPSAILCGFFAAIASAADQPQPAPAESSPAIQHYRAEVEPILEQYCFGCHGYGASEGNRTLDEFASDEALLADTGLWHAVLKNLRSGMMPPAEEEQPTQEERDKVIEWIKTEAFDLDPADLDPGHVTLRRLNRVEYRNTIRDLMGVDYDTMENFPPDDSGYGFDNIGDSLSISPLLMEKYIQAAEKVVDRAVPKVARVPKVKRIPGREIKNLDGSQQASKLSYYDPAVVFKNVRIEQSGDYRIVVEARIDGYWEFDPGSCEVSCEFNDKQIFHETYAWNDSVPVPHEFTEHLEPGEYLIRFELKPLTPVEKRLHFIYYRVNSIRVEGPLDEEFWVPHRDYAKFFPDRPPPADSAGRDEYAGQVLAKFGTRAFRRPIDAASVDKLAAIAKLVYEQPGKSFEEGVGQAMVAVLASPRFLFRMEEAGPAPPSKSYPLVDEYSLASRLSYFLWSTMPDQELIDLAGRGELRANFDAQLQRMLADRRSEAFIRNFTGQWLQARDVQTIAIDAVAALGYQQEWESLIDEFRAQRRRDRRERRRLEREQTEELAAAENEGPEAIERVRAEHQRLAAEAEKVRDERRDKAREKFEKFEALRLKFNDEVRSSMRRETEMAFEHVMRNDRSVLELLDANYTFLNHELAKFYGIEGVEGDDMRLVELPADSPRGGILTQGTVLVVTSNPTRTSPVKRGLFVLDNILGTPAPPPPEAVPPLEASAESVAGHEASLREALEIHRKDPLCAACHARFDPIGLAMENFNAIGMWRDEEHGRPIDTAGTLLTGEPFQTIRDLKKVLKTERKLDFYRCLTEKLLTYATGRGLEYFDEPTIDQIVRQLDQQDGRFSVLLQSVVESPPFQQQRPVAPAGEQPAADQQAAHDGSLPR
jgi:mono/diheme cytochrome c family protein